MFQSPTLNFFGLALLVSIDTKHYFDAAGSGAKYYPKIATHIRKMEF